MQSTHQGLTRDVEIGEGGSPSQPPSPEEKRLLELLEQAPPARFTAILKCIPGWQFEGQANLRNWRKVLEKLKAQLATALAECPRLVVAAASPSIVSPVVGADIVMADDGENQFTEQVYEALRFTAILLENATNKHLYNAVEHVVTLMGARNERVAFEATHVVAMLSLPPQQHRHVVDTSVVHIDPPASANTTLRRRLLVLAQGPGASSSGGVEEFPDQWADEQSMDDDGQQSTAPPTVGFVGATIYQFYRPLESSDELVSIPMNQQMLDQLTATRPTDADPLLAPSACTVGNICEELIATYAVPPEHQFALLTRLRGVVASSRPQKEQVTTTTILRLHALLALFYLFNDSMDVASLVEKNPSLARNVVELIRVEKSEYVPLRVRICALQVLSALVYDRADRGGTGGVLGRQSNVLQALGVAKGAPHGVFPSLVRFAMAELSQLTSTTLASASETSLALSSASTAAAAAPSSSAEETDNDMEMSLAVAFVQATTDLLTPQDAQVLRAGLFRDLLHPQQSELCWIEAVLVLLNHVVAMQSGAGVMTESGVVPALLHVASSQATSALHISLITLCIQALETTVSIHTAAAALYRELSGANIIIDRLHVEIASIGTSTTVLSETKTVLITALLGMLSVSFHSQGVMSAGATSRVIRDGSVLSKSLIQILRNIDTFGPAVFAQAAIVVSDIVNNDPGSVNQVHSGGIADAFLETITRWDVKDLEDTNRLLPVSAELIMAIPSVLSALCLTSAHAEKVSRAKPLLYVMDFFATSRFASDTCDHLQGDVAAIVGSGVFEMMRQVAGFQKAAIQACVAAAKKIIRFGEQLATRHERDEVEYKKLLRMATHFGDVLEPILSKSEHAASFADHGGVQCLLTIYQLVLPTAPVFLSSLVGARAGAGGAAGVSSASHGFAHQPAAQSITLALRSFATHQSVKMLTAVMNELKQANALLDGAASVKGLLSSLPEIGLTELFTRRAAPAAAAADMDEEAKDASTAIAPVVAEDKIHRVGAYLHRLAFVEWVVGLLDWTMQVGQSSLQNRAWFMELFSRSNTATLESLFSVCRSVQLERACLVGAHRSSTEAAAATPAIMSSTSSSGETPKIKGLWKLCSLLLLRFDLVVRNLLVSMCKTFVFIPGMRTRGDESANLMATHAQPMANFVGSMVKKDIQFVCSQQQVVEDPFVKKYYLVFVLETVMQTVFDAKKRQLNALVLSKLLQPVEAAAASQSFSCLHDLISCLLSEDGLSSTDVSMKRMQETCVRVCANALEQLGDLEVLRTSQVTVSLVANNANVPSNSSGSDDTLPRFDLRKLSLQLHRLCLRFVVQLWQTTSRGVDKYAQELLPAVVMLLRHRLDRESGAAGSAAASAAAAGAAVDARLDPMLQRFGGGPAFGGFPGGPGGVLDREDFLQALFGATGRPGTGGGGRRPPPTGPFQVDTAVVDSLVGMGFQRTQVERAVRRVRVNDVEVAMEWLLSHDVDGDDDEDEEEEQEAEAQAEAAAADAEAVSSDAATTGTAAQAEADTQSEEEKEVYQGYVSLRDGFEQSCFAILKHHATQSSPTSAAESAMGYELQAFVVSLAQCLALLCSKVDDERQHVVTRVSEALLQAMHPSESVAAAAATDRYVMMLAHLLALLLQLDTDSIDVLTTQTPLCVDAIVDYLRVGVNNMEDGGSPKESFAPLLLVLDAIQARDLSSAPPPSLDTPAEDPPRTKKITLAVRRELVKLAVTLMSSSQLQRNTAQALWQLLVRLTLEYETAHELYTVGGLDKLLNLTPNAVFPGYKEMTAVLLVHMLESPQVLEHMMEDKIHQTMKKLAERYGPPSQMRITPRVLMMEIASVAARNEGIFMQALQKAVVFKKTESGRVYVLQKEEAVPPPAGPGQAAATTATATGSATTTTAGVTPAPAPLDQTHPHATHHGEKKSLLHKLPKVHRNHAQVIVSHLVEKICDAWKTEKLLPETRGRAGFSETSDEEKENDPLVVSVGTFLHLLVQVVSAFPACAAVLTKQAHTATPPSFAAGVSGGAVTTATGSAGSSDAHKLVVLALRELLPCKALCQFAAIRRSLEFTGFGVDDDAATVAKRSRDALTLRTRERLLNTHKLLVTIGTQPGDGPKVIVGELVKCFQEWPACTGCGSKDSETKDLSVGDDAALSALHAWSALIMSILWPRGAAPKSFSWDKIVLGGGLSGKYAFVTLLVETLRKIKLSHPFAHATCSMILRPLTTLTRPFVLHRVKKLLLKKRSSSTVGVAETHEEEQASVNRDSHGDGATAGSAAEDPFHFDAEGDVPMRSPSSVSVEGGGGGAAGGDHEMQEPVDHMEDDDASERSSLSDENGDHHHLRLGHRHSHEHEEYDDDEDEDNEEEDDEEEEDEDEDDDDDDENEDEDEDDDEDEDEDDDEDEDEEMDEEEGRIRLRMSRRHHHDTGASRASRGVSGGVFGAEPSGNGSGDGGGGFEEADDDEFSYLRLLDDESILSTQARAAARLRAARSRPPSATPTAGVTGGGDPMLRSLVDLFSVDGGGGAGAGGAMRGGVRDLHTGVFTFGDDDEDDEDDPDMAFRHRDHGGSMAAFAAASSSGSSLAMGNMGSALANLLDSGDATANENDFIFETVDVGGSAAAAAAAATPTVAAARGSVGGASARSVAAELVLPTAASSRLHPLLLTPADRNGGPLGGGILLPDRLPLPRHNAPSLFRELNVLVRQMNSNLHLANNVGIHASLMGRGGHGGGAGAGGRHRPPSRNNRLSAVSNLLSEFSLDLPGGHGAFGRAGGGALRGLGGGIDALLRRGDRELLGGGGVGGGRGLRGDIGMDTSAALLWGTQGAGRAGGPDTRTIATRLEQYASQNLVVPDAPPPPASASSASGGGGATEQPLPQTDETTADPATVEPPPGEGADTQSQAGEAALSDTASIVALASTLGESSLRSPQQEEEIVSEPDMMATSPSPASPPAVESSATSAVLATSAPTATATAPAPVVAAPSNNLLNFTLDLSSFQPPPAPTATATEALAAAAAAPAVLPPPPPPAAPSANVVVEEEEMKSADEEEEQDQEDTTTTGLVCPEGVDPEVFAFLPLDMQAEIVAQHAPPAAAASSTASASATAASAGGDGGASGLSQLEQDMANSSFDRETLEALPEDIRAEVLANERREREAVARAAAAPEADISRAEEMDNASFVASLTPDLRIEILTTCDDAFLQTLSSQVQAEAMVLRERAAYRPIYQENDAHHQQQQQQRAARRLGTATSAAQADDGGGDIFRRPTLRRMLTSHGVDPLTGRRSGRGGRFPGDESGATRGDSRRAGDTSSSSTHAGMMRVPRDEDEPHDDRILQKKSVQALVRLLFLAQSIVSNRVFQRLMTNVCLYPLTRECVRKQLLQIVSSPLQKPVLALPEQEENTDETKFPPTHLYGTSIGSGSGGGAAWPSSSSSAGVPAEVLGRVLSVLVTVARHNARFTVELLSRHKDEEEDKYETGVHVLVELLGTSVVNRSALLLETLLELVELVLLPLERLPREATGSGSMVAKKEEGAGLGGEEEKKQEEEEDQPQVVAVLSSSGAEWVRVPQVTMPPHRMDDLVGVLTLPICSPSMQERTIQILKLLHRVANNRPLILDALVRQAKKLTTPDKFRKCAASSNASGFEAAAVLTSAQDELQLLRLVHTLSDVSATTTEFNECCAAMGLDDLWDALSESLDHARVAAGEAAAGMPVLAVTPTTPTTPAQPATASASTAEDEQAAAAVEGMVIEGKSAGASVAMAALLARFLPMVEAFFVVSARDAASMPLCVPDSAEREEAFVTALREGGLESIEASSSSASDGGPAHVVLKRLTSSTLSESGGGGSETSTTLRLASFVEANRVLLNLLVREKPSLLDSSFAALIKLPRCRAYLDFDNKRTYFQSAMKKLRASSLRAHGSTAAVRLSVRRDHIFEDSYYALRMRSGAELRRKLHIAFTNEEGIDAGGVTREWYVILAREIFNPNYVLFTSAADSPTFQPNPLSYVNKDHLSYFEFVGKVIGKAVADGQLLDAHFTRSFYKHILQLPISYHDMEAIDPEYYRNLHSILDNCMDDLGLELTFSADQSNFGRVEVVDLIPNGRHIMVNDNNKMEYVKLVTHHRMATGIRQQIDAFLKGFHQLVPPEMISIFNENELELLISGMPEIDIDDLKANTDYANYKPTDPVIRWFWNVLYACTHEERALFLQFVTGTSKVPLEGFKALEGMRGTHKFNIHKAFGNPNALPSAHTCFNQLDLPEYESEDKLRQCLLLAIREGSEGFGFG